MSQGIKIDSQGSQSIVVFFVTSCVSALNVMSDSLRSNMSFTSELVTDGVKSLHQLWQNPFQLQT